MQALLYGTSMQARSFHTSIAVKRGRERACPHERPVPGCALQLLAVPKFNAKKAMECGRSCGCIIDSLQERGHALETAIMALPSAKLLQQCRDRLLKLVRGETKFVSKLALQPHKSEFASSTNFSHLEAVVEVLQHPLVNKACSLMQILPAISEEKLCPPYSIFTDIKRKEAEALAYVDLVCFFKQKPAWVMVSARNPKHLSWIDEGDPKKGLKSRILLLLNAAYLHPVIRPSVFVLVFARGVEDKVSKNLEESFSAVKVIYDDVEDDKEVRPTRHLINISSNSEPFCQGENFYDVEDGEWVILQTMPVLPSQASSRPSEVDKNYHVQIQNRCHTTCKYIPVGNIFPLIIFEIEVDRCIESINLDGHASLQHSSEPDGHLMLSNCAAQDRSSKTSEEGQESQAEVFSNSASELHCPNLSKHNFEQGCVRLPNFFYHMNLLEEDMSSLRTMEVVNLDTTVLIGIVSELSNGGAYWYSEMPLKEMEVRFGSLSSFVKEQALLELQKSFLLEIESLFRKQRPIVSQYAWEEFWSIVSVIGGPHEMQRASDLSRVLRHAIVPNSPSPRLMALPETKKIQKKHKIVFGTGDNLYAPTLTSNVTFVRAAVQRGMAFATINHRPLALTGD